MKCPICHLVFKSDDRSNCRKNDPIRTDVEKLHEHQQDKNLLHVMSDVKRTISNGNVLDAKGM